GSLESNDVAEADWPRTLQGGWVMFDASRARWRENGEGLAWRFLLFVLAILLLGGACASDEKETPEEGEKDPPFEISKAVLDFGIIPTGSEKALRVELTN